MMKIIMKAFLTDLIFSSCSQNNTTETVFTIDNSLQSTELNPDVKFD